MRHLLDALDPTRLGPAPARLAAVTEVRNVPARWARVLVTGSNFNLQTLMGVTEVGRHRRLLHLLHADDYGLLQAAEAGRCAGGEPSNLPRVRQLPVLLARHEGQHVGAVHGLQGVRRDADGVGQELARATGGALHAQVSLRRLQARTLPREKGEKLP